MIHITIHLQAEDAFSTVLISKFFSFSGSLMNFPNLYIVASSMLSISYSTNVCRSLVSPSNFKDAAHQSISILSVSGFFLFSRGFGYNTKQRAYITILITVGGFFIDFNKSRSFFSKTFKASSAAFKAGKASAKSFSQSSFIALASSTAT